jgi:hypothetical protein
MNVKITKRQLKRIIREADSLVEFWKGKEKSPNLPATGVTFDWDSGGSSMKMYVDGKETISFMTQKEVRDLITQLEDLLAGPMRTSP